MHRQQRQLLSEFHEKLYICHGSGRQQQAKDVAIPTSVPGLLASAPGCVHACVICPLLQVLKHLLQG